MYRNLNDYEILYMVEDSDNSFNLLLKKYEPLIYKVAKDYHYLFKRFGYEMDDLMQIGYITLYKVVKFYDNYNDTWFYSYFKKALNNAFISNIRWNSTNKKEVLNQALSYDVEIPNTSLCYLDLFHDQKDINNYYQELTVFKNSMPILLSWTFELFYNGYTKEEISLLLEEKLENIKNYLNKIKEHALTYKSLFFY